MIGPNAAGVHTGGYSYDPAPGVSVLDGIRTQARRRGRGALRRGRAHHREPRGLEGLVGRRRDVAPDPAEDAARIAEAVAAAKGADVALLVVGENEAVCREGWSETAPRRSRQPRSAGPSGRDGEGRGRDRHAHGRAADQRPAALGGRGDRERARGARGLLSRTGDGHGRRRRALRRRRTPAASCRSPSRATSASSPPITTRSLRPSAASCSPTSRRSSRSATGSATRASATATCGSRPRRSPVGRGDRGLGRRHEHRRPGRRRGRAALRPRPRRVGHAPDPRAARLRARHARAGRDAHGPLPPGGGALAFYDREKKRVVEPGTFDVMVGGSSAQLKTAPLEVSAR